MFLMVSGESMNINPVIAFKTTVDIAVYQYDEGLIFGASTSALICSMVDMSKVVYGFNR